MVINVSKRIQSHCQNQEKKRKKEKTEGRDEEEYVLKLSYDEERRQNRARKEKKVSNETWSCMKSETNSLSYTTYILMYIS